MFVSGLHIVQLFDLALFCYLGPSIWKHDISRGTKSVLIGAHCFFLHPFFVAESWRSLFGFPKDYRLWFAFFLHDIGYIGKAEMDSEDGELHPLTGAQIMHNLFDNEPTINWNTVPISRNEAGYKWYNFCLGHSRHLAKRFDIPFSKLCVADKLAGVITPTWLYLPMVTLTGEIEEYMESAKKHFAANPDKARPEFEAMASGDKVKWHKAFQSYMRQWVEAHKDGQDDTWTPNRYGKKIAA